MESLTYRKRSLRQINSGFNHILGKIATKNKIAIGIDMEELSNSKKEEKAETIEKIINNIKVARKARTKIVLLNYKDKRDAANFLISLGASTKQAKEAF